MKSEENRLNSLLPPTLNDRFINLTLTSQSTTYQTYKSEFKDDHSVHTIRVLDLNSTMAQEDWDKAATLFIQELLYLSSNKLVSIESFEISEKRIACATVPSTTLSAEMEKLSKKSLKLEVNTEKLLRNIMHNIQFLHKELKMPSCRNIIRLDNIYQFREDFFVLGDWAGACQTKKSNPNGLVDSTPVEAEYEEIFKLGLVALGLNGIKSQEIERMLSLKEKNPSDYDRAMKNWIRHNLSSESEATRNYLERVLGKDPTLRPSLAEVPSSENLEKCKEQETLREELKVETIVPKVKQDHQKLHAYLQAFQRPPELVAWCSGISNLISLYDLQTNQPYAAFYGTKLQNFDKYHSSWTHVREIPNSDLLVSVHHSFHSSAKFSIFDLSKERGGVASIFDSDEITGGVVGRGDIAYNRKRNLLALMPLSREVAYHLYNIEEANHTNKVVFLRKAKWNMLHTASAECIIEGLDFDPVGNKIAMIDTAGTCLVSKVDTDDYLFHLQFSKPDAMARCRWSAVIGDSAIFAKHNYNKLNLIDVEKKELLFKASVELEKQHNLTTYWIDTCWSDENLLATGGEDKIVKVFDRRAGKIVKSFPRNIHEDYINCVRWNSNGTTIATASDDQSIKVLDFKTGKLLLLGKTIDDSKNCFLFKKVIGLL